ncbi:uncharacterized protein [Primulina huaijiensis]|uniref:uncharacterized protein n=1 Tax=Primulina huaijiensis TaxID=1492673 RepID=UPI003CC6FEAF
MIKWIVELGEYDIEYKPRVAIKAQALSDFLSEMVQPGEDEVWIVFLDGASSLDGCGVGVVVISPPREKIKLALKIDSRVTNNEAEYEAVLAGIRAAQEIGASRVILYSDSQLITQQIKGAYEANDDRMLKYLQLIKTQAAVFADWSIEQIPQKENGEADTFAKMAASLSEGPLLKCLASGEVDYVIREIHEGCCGEHLGGITLARKEMLAGFWWPTISQDSAQWGMDIVGLFSIARAQKKFLLVAVDYFSKWVEAEPLAKITEQEVLKFLLKNIVCQFGVPRRLISDNGRQFQCKEITSWCQEMKITQFFTSVAYPQANGQTEVVNRIIVQALKTRLQGKGKDWVEELPSVLWAYRTTPREPTQETPFNLVYGSETVLLVEIGQSSAQVESYPDDNDSSRAMELDLLEEKRDQAMIQMEAYRGRVIKSYNKRVQIRDFQVGDLVMKKVNPEGVGMELVNRAREGPEEEGLEEECLVYWAAGCLEVWVGRRRRGGDGEESERIAVESSLGEPRAFAPEVEEVELDMIRRRKLRRRKLTSF